MKTNLNNAIRQYADGYEPGQDFATKVMKRVRRRVLMQRVLSVSGWTVLAAVAVGAAVYFLYPIIATVVVMPLFVPMCVTGVLLCAMLLCDQLLRQKYLQDKFG